MHRPTGERKVHLLTGAKVCATTGGKHMPTATALSHGSMKVGEVDHGDAPPPLRIIIVDAHSKCDPWAMPAHGEGDGEDTCRCDMAHVFGMHIHLHASKKKKHAVYPLPLSNPYTQHT